MNKIFFIMFIFVFLPLNVECMEIKIGLITSEKDIVIGSSKNATLTNLFTNQIITKLNKQEAYIVENHLGLISLFNKLTNKTTGAFTGPVVLNAEENGFVFCNKKYYRGKLIISANKDLKNITIINNVNLEDYLLSVVPAEMPNHWHKEALKAQTVAARTYALGFLGRRKNKGYDLEATVEDQVYSGILSERNDTTLAVRETKDEILTDEFNRPIIALYHSSGGGYTDSIENLWEKDDVKPSVHIQPRPDYDDDSPHFKWHRKYKVQDINNILSRLGIGEIKEIIIISRTPANRVMKLEIKGTTGNTSLRGEEFRKYLKLPSSKFNFVIKNEDILFAGSGFGHGLGLSQWGSKALAEKGFTYKEILAHYYPETMFLTLTNNVK